MDQRFFIIFSLMFLGYTCIVYDRQSISYAAPVIAKVENLENSDLGLIISSQHLGYLVVKTVAGTLADVIEPGLLFSSSLFLTGLALTSFTAASSVSMFSLAAFLSGFAQGPGWGACAVLLKQLVASEQFATWWGVLSVSANVAGTIGPFLAASLIGAYGWRGSFVSASTATMALAGVTFVILRILTKQDKKAKGAGSQRRFQDVFTPQLGVVFLLYMMVSMVRGACNDWGPMYLVQGKGMSMLTGSSFSSSQEIGGIVGSIVAGYVADIMISKNSGTVRPRYLITLLLTALQTVAVLVFIFFVNSQSSQLWVGFLAFLIGFGMYGAITLYGVLAMEVAPPNLEGTSHSIVMLGSNLGRVMAGYPLSVIATWMTWHESFIAVFLVSFLSLLMSFVALHQKEASHKKKV